MDKLFIQLLPELTLVAVACLLFLLGVSPKASSRHLSAWIALITLVALFFVQLPVVAEGTASGMGVADLATSTVNNGAFVQYVRLIVFGVGSVLILLAWPTNRDATGSDSLNFGQEAGEFYALMLLALAGVLLVASANDIILLFLGIELASIPTYIMVSISRPLPVAQEAGVKYFFLGAMAAAVMLFGFSYLYGTTGSTRLQDYVNVNVNAASVQQIQSRLNVTPDVAEAIEAARPFSSAADVQTGVPLNKLAGEIGTLSKGEQDKLSDLRRSVANDLNDHPAIYDDPAFDVALTARFRAILTPDHQAKLDGIIHPTGAGAPASNGLFVKFSNESISHILVRPDSIMQVFDEARMQATDGKSPVTMWQTLAIVIILVGFTFKIAAVPLHEYAGDVYQGAATPVTAFLAFVPKTTGFLAIIKVLSAVGGVHWSLPPLVVHMLWVIAALTMTIGNALGLLQFNVKRVLAYSSVAHSGYMLVGITALAHAFDAFKDDPNGAARAAEVQGLAIGGVLFYLAAYGIMNCGTFGVLMLLPTRDVGEFARPGSPQRPPVATTAETYDDLAGQGKKHVALGLAMAVCCFSLIGIPLTVGFIGKVYLIQPALAGGLFWLVVITMINAAISAGYYLKIVATMFLRPSPDADPAAAPVYARHHAAPHGLAAIAHAPFALSVAVVLSVAGTIMFGTVVPAAEGLTHDVRKAAGLQTPAAAVSAQTPQASAR